MNGKEGGGRPSRLGPAFVSQVPTPRAPGGSSESAYPLIASRLAFAAGTMAKKPWSVGQA